MGKYKISLADAQGLGHGTALGLEEEKEAGVAQLPQGFEVPHALGHDEPGPVESFLKGGIGLGQDQAHGAGPRIQHRLQGGPEAGGVEIASG